MQGIIIEITAGVGGKEAMIFCNELLTMYCNYCDNQGWDYSITSCEMTDLEGVRHASLTINNSGTTQSIIMFPYIYIPQ